MCFTCPSCSSVELLRFGELLFRFACDNYFEDVYGWSGLLDMLLNHNHYIKTKNVCSAQCSILHVSRDIIDLTSLRRRIND